MNTAHTVMTAGLLKPEMASVALTRPLRLRETNTRRATRSARTQPVTKGKTAAATIPKRTIISGVNDAPPLKVKGLRS
jgi:hypothetical protein